MEKETSEKKMKHAIEKTKIYELLKTRDSQFVATIDKVTPIVTPLLANRVPHIFPEYTLHDIEHSARLINYIYELIPNIDKFNDLELALMILSSIFHDMGMTLGKEDIRKIENNEYFKKEEINYKAYKKLYGGNAIQEIIRKKHADISASIVEKDFKADLTLNNPRGVSYCDDICLLCSCHTKDYLWMKDKIYKHNVKGDYPYNLLFIAHLLRIADLMDIDQCRTPYELYKLIDPEGISNDEWRQHFIITNSKKVEEDKNTKKRNIVFYGQCEDIKIHRKLFSYIEWINNELDRTIKYIEEIGDEKYYLNLSNKVSTFIAPKGYTVSDYRLELDFKEITKLLMGENIYGDKRLGLREIIQNAIDACLVRKEIEEGKGTDYSPEVKVILDEKDNVFTIKDNGIGMSEDVIKDHFLKIGKSFYRSDAFKLNDFNYQPIGTYGIGFLACFMLSGDVTIETRYHKESYKYEIQLERGDEYISFNTVNDVSYVGTEIKLIYKEVMQIFGNNIENVKAFMNEYFITDYYKLELIYNKNKDYIDHSIRKHIETKSDKGDIIIDVSKYMNKTEGFFRLKNKHKFLRKIQDLDEINENIYFYKDGDIIKKEIAFKDIVNNQNNTLIYLELPFYDDNDRDDIDKAIEILGDIDEALNRFVPNDSIYIFFFIEDQPCLEKKCIYQNDDEYVYEKLSIDNVIDICKIDGFCPVINVIEVNLIEGPNCEILIPYHKYIKPYYYSSSERLYLRNIYINKYYWGGSLLANSISVEGLSLNILNKEIFPDVSRNQLMPSSKEIVDNAITLAIHIAAIEQYDLTDEEKNIMKIFIKNKLNYDDALIKQELITKYLK